MIDRIIEGLYVADAGSVLDKSRIDELKQLQITHILTVSAHCIPMESRIKGICYMDVFALDTDTQDMFADNKLNNCLKYISSSIGIGGRVLVHCEAGMSRSVFVVAAYLMQTYRWSSGKVIEYIQRIRPSAQPNDGFLQQLQIFEEANFDANIEIVSLCSQYRKWSLSVTAMSNGLPGSSHSSVAFDPTRTLNDKMDQSQYDYRCRKCRKILFYDKHIMKHTVTKVNVAVNNESADCDFRYLLLPMNWMSMTEYQGKIYCPICSEKLGHYIWGGRICDGSDGRQCGTAVRPWIYVNQNKIDQRVIANGSPSNPMNLIINRPLEDSFQKDEKS